MLECFEVYRAKAVKAYGLSGVNQLEHALQGAAIAERDGRSPAFILATLFHDIGHMVHELGQNPAARGIDDRHEQLGADYLARFFPETVCAPVRLHVAAKRYLTAVDKDYFARLSSESVRSLELQGGPMSEVELAAFRALPGWQEAVHLRQIDEAAKRVGAPTPTIDHYLPYARQVTGAL